MPVSSHLRKAESSLRACALAYPDAYEEHPWGHRAIKVKGKTFVFLALDKDGSGFLSMSVKLPFAGAAALSLPFAEPTHYGLGKCGWVTAKFFPKGEVPVDLLRSWIDESFRAIAPRSVLAQLTENPKIPAKNRPAGDKQTRKQRRQTDTG